MRHLFRTLILALPVVLAAATSCTENEPEDITRTTEGSKVYLKIGSVSTSELTKSAIEGTSFPTAEAASIGLFIDGEGYTGDKYTNVRYTKPEGSDSWAADPEIELQAAEATVYGYYPYQAGITGISSIPVSSSVDGDDWMWATPVTEVSSSNPEVSLSMNHALALVEVTFNIMGYAEGSEMTALTLTAGSFAQEGTLNATDGTVTPGTDATGGCQLLADNQTLAIKDGKIVAKCLLVPKGLDGRQDMTIACTLDGKNLKATLTGSKGVTVKSGTKSTVSLNVKGTTMEVAEVSVSGWNDGATTANVGGHTVTVSSTDIPAAITAGTDITTDDESVEKASQTATISYDRSVLADGKYGVDVTCDKTGACTVSHNAAAGTITVSNVTADVTVTLTKKVNWYDVTLTIEGNGTAYIGTPGTTAARCNAGGTITLTAVPSTAEEEFIGWQDAAGTSLSTDNPLTYTPSSDIAVKAVFTTRILSGEFTVGTDRKARFSGGNLWYDGSNFKFESEQYESTPSSSGDRDSTHVSHFMWCALAEKAKALSYETATATTFFAASGFTVYGNSSWYTPKHSEVQYLLYNRNASTVCGVANARWFKGRINTGVSTYVNGLFLIPDVFTWPASVTVDPSANINNRDAGYSAASFSLAEFKALEQAGIVFLPAAGNRNGYNGSETVSNVNTEGFYWVSGRMDGIVDEYAEEVHFSDAKLYPEKSGIAQNYRYMAQSVRLLINVTE